jgi:nucleoside-diphosphate-sugar epimerase/predicted lipid carrier protein YhbT
VEIDLLKTETIFLTGITGTLGGWLAREALEAGHRLIVLVRNASDSQSQDRVVAALDLAGAGQWHDRVEILDGDLCLKNFGSNQTENVLKGCDRIIHSAAMTSFQPNLAEENRRTNIDGTKNILDVAATGSLPLVYISTAYVAGCREGVATEDELDCGQSFNNSYEQTKCQAEQLVRRWSEQTSLETIILRPSIVLGDSRQGRIGRFNTIYDMMRIFEIIKTYNSDMTLRVVANPSATKNLIPIDYFARLAWHLIARRQPGTFHITNPNPMTIETMQGIFSQLFKINKTRLVDPDALNKGQLTKSERLFRNAGSVYEPYLLHEQIFDRTAIDATLVDADIAFPTMDLAYFQRLLEYARSTEWGRRVVPKNIPTQEAPPTALSDYFSDFFTRKLNYDLVPELQSLDASFKITMKESSHWHWSFTIEQGELIRISRNGQATECDFIVDMPTFSDIVAARISPQQAFIKQQIQIKGDMEVGLKIAAVLSEFFRQCPSQVVLEHNESKSLLDQTV